MDNQRILELFEADFEYVFIMFSGVFNLVLFFSCSISLFRFYCPAHSTIDCMLNQICYRLTHFVMASVHMQTHLGATQCFYGLLPLPKQPKMSAENSTQKFPQIGEPSLSLWPTYPKSKTS